MSVRVRIGPSPTGDPHVGTAYISLFNYVFAKQHGGKFVLRIEDTDQTRSKPEWEQMIIDSLRWLGLDWDEGPDVGGEYGPYRQSERGHIYGEYAQMLLDKGAAYRCFCTTEELDQIRKAQRAAGSPLGYDGRGRDVSDDEVQANLKAGKPFVIRLKVPRPGKTIVKDRLRGDIEFDNGQIDDQVLLKTDGMPTYHLANVVDDHLMKISHVMRAEEWISSTPKHVMLYDAFGWEAPEFIHMPLLRNKDKSKISKRKNPVSINYYKEVGFLPDALLNYLGMMGWTMPDGEEKFTVDDMVKNFDFDRISLGGPVFDIQKLTWLNGLYIREESVESIVEQLRANILTDEALHAIAGLVHKRIDKLEDFIDQTAFFFGGDLSYDEKATKMMLPKGREQKEMVEAFQRAAEVIDVMAELELDSLTEAMNSLREELGLKGKEFFMPLRIAVTGTKNSPPLFDSMVVLGKERCRRRLRMALQHLKTYKPS